MLFKKRTPQPVQSVAKSLQDAPASVNHEVAEVKKEETMAERLTRAGHVCAPLVGSVTRGACRLICGRVFAIDYSREPILKDNYGLQDAPASANHEVAEVKKEETVAERLTRAGHVCAPLVGSVTRGACRLICGRVFAIDYSREPILKDNYGLQIAPASANHEVAEVKKEESTDERLIREGRVLAPLVENANKPRSPYAIINRKLYKIDYSKEPVLSY